jgi:type IV fimbrial biogenesis protein FimT
VEIIINLAAAGILLSAAVPPFQDFFIRNEMSTEVNTFLAALHFARSESVKRRQDLSLCHSAPGDACDASKDWSQGSIVYADLDNDDKYGSGDVVISQNPALPSRLKNTAKTTHITFNSRGRSNAGSFSFADAGGVADSRCKTVSSTDRSYVRSAGYN